MIKGIIFDLDGVLISTDKYHFEAWKKIADKYGIYFDEEINNRLRGVSRMKSLEIILEQSNKAFSKEEKQKIAEEKNDYYVSFLDILSCDNVLSSTFRLLEQLKRLNIKLAVGSSSKNAMKILLKTTLIKYFDYIVDGNMIKKTKPDPEVFVLASKGLSLKPDECLVIEDAITGIDAAFSGGFISVAIGDAKKNIKASYQIDELSDILKIIR